MRLSLGHCYVKLAPSSCSSCMPTLPSLHLAGYWVRHLVDRVSQQFEELWEREGVERYWAQHLAAAVAAGADAPVVKSEAAMPAAAEETAAAAAAGRHSLHMARTAGQAGGALAAAGSAPAGTAGSAGAGVAAAMPRGGTAAAQHAVSSSRAERLAERAAAVRERHMQAALRAFEEAEDDPASWRQALHLLRQARKGGDTLKVSSVPMVCFWRLLWQRQMPKWLWLARVWATCIVTLPPHEQLRATTPQHARRALLACRTS